MKTVFLLIIITFIAFDSSHANVPVGSENQKANLCQFANDSRERKVLLYNCQTIKWQVNERFAGLNGPFDSPGGSSGRIQALQHYLTQYLHSVNSDESWKLLREMQANNFADWTK